MATIKSNHGVGITVTMRVGDIDEVWCYLQDQGVEPGPIKTRWEAQVFYFYDPEGHRLEVWAGQQRNEG